MDELLYCTALVQGVYEHQDFQLKAQVHLLS